jgi:hypothetical protein
VLVRSEYDYASESITDECETYGDAAAVMDEAVDTSDEWEYEYVVPGEPYGYPKYMSDGVDSEGPTDEETSEWQGHSEAYPYEEYAYPESTMGAAEDSDSDEFSYYDEPGYGYEPDYCDYEPEPGIGDEYDDSESFVSESEWEWEAALEGRLEGEPGEPIEGCEEEPSDYDEVDPYEYYGYDYGEGAAETDRWAEDSGMESYEWADEEAAIWEPESEPVVESGLELFAWHPSELLILADREILRTLEMLGNEPSGVRRATLNDYLEALGWEAIAFASRFEDVAGIEVLGLADDLPGAAAFLGVFRLVEQGELGMDEAVDLLERSLDSLSLDWIEGVSEMTAGGFDDWDARPTAGQTDGLDWSDAGPASGPVVDVIVSLAARSLASLGTAICGVSRTLSELDWERVAAAATESRAADNLAVGEEFLQR